MTVIFRLPILYKWSSIFERSVNINTWKKVTKKEYTISTEKDLPLILSIISMGWTIILSLIGILSSNWVLFLSILILSVTFSSIQTIIGKLSNKYRTSKLKMSISWILIFSNTTILMLSVLNHFHLKLDFYDILLNLI